MWYNFKLWLSQNHSVVNNVGPLCCLLWTQKNNVSTCNIFRVIRLEEKFLTLSLSLSVEVLRGFPQFVQENSAVVLRLDHICFLPDTYRFIPHWSSYLQVQHILSSWLCLNKKNTRENVIKDSRLSIWRKILATTVHN